MFPLIGIFWSFVERESATAWLLVGKEDYNDSESIVQSRALKCSVDHAKRLFYRAVNEIFGKIGKMASEEVI